MIDLHSHLLPNVDDGAQSLAVALAMLDEYRQLGFSTVVATPHWTYPTDEGKQDHIQSVFEEITRHAESRNIRLLLGRECMLPPDPKSMLDDIRLSINQSHFYLVEVPFKTRPLFLEQSVFGLQASGNTVVIAHPERYLFLQQDIEVARIFVEQGILLQINIGSIKGLFGRAAQKAARELLLHGLVHLVATDAHSDGGRLHSVTQGLNLISELIGEQECGHLVNHNPGLILDGQVPIPVVPRKVRWPTLGRWIKKLT